VNLGGLVFSGKLTVPTTDGAMPPLSFIQGLGFFKFTCDKPSPYLSSGADHLDFRLSSTSGETLSIYASDRSNLIERISCAGGQQRDQSEGRLPDGSTNIYRPLPKPTPGDSNFQKLTGVLINEVLTHTDLPLEDAIELYNPNPFPTNIANWWLSNS